MSLDLLSQILVVVGISASQKEFILTTFRKLYISPQPEKDLEVSLDYACTSTKEIEKSCIKSNGEHPAKPEIEELTTCPSASLVCISETNYPSLDGMTEHNF